MLSDVGPSRWAFNTRLDHAAGSINLKDASSAKRARKARLVELVLGRPIDPLAKHGVELRDEKRDADNF